MKNLPESQEFAFEFEKNFNSQSAQKWMSEHWTDSIFYSVLYVLIIFGLEKVMKNRPALKIDRVLVVWNLLLAVFSIFATYRTVPELASILANHGFYESVCDSSFVANKVTGFWTFLFIMSKLMELIDTLFIVLRKRPLTVLHVGHHASTLVYAWYNYKDFQSLTRWLMIMNVFVHSLMYTYFSLAIMKYKPPRTISIMLTSLQIAQMIMGLILNVCAFVFSRTNGCQMTQTSIIFGFIMYCTFFYLFVKFFLDAYIFDKRGKKKSM